MDYKTRIGQEIGETLSDPSKYARRVLPLLAVVETIATKGKSPGTSALRQQEIIAEGVESRHKREQEAYERQEREYERRQDAIDRELRRRYTEARIGRREKEDEGRKRSLDMEARRQGFDKLLKEVDLDDPVAIDNLRRQLAKTGLVTNAQLLEILNKYYDLATKR